MLLAMRVGDFYEFYGDDAETAAQALEITLTGKQDGDERVPMAGVPYHSFQKYLAKLVQAGFKVAICEQLEDPKLAKGLVKRGVTRVITPGTLVEDAMLESRENNFLGAICVQNGRIGLATLDSSTGEFAATELEGELAEDRLLSELIRIRPAEILADDDQQALLHLVQKHMGAAITKQASFTADRASRKLQDHFKVSHLDGFGLSGHPNAVVAASMILAYAERNGLGLSHVDSLSTYSVDAFMRVDHATRRSLELTQNLQDGGRKFTLLSAIDATKTPMGSRLLRKWIEQPLIEVAPIQARLDAVERLKDHSIARDDLRDELGKIFDLERLVARCASGFASPRDLGALRASLAALPRMVEPLAKVAFGRIQEVKSEICDLTDLRRALELALVDDPPPIVRDGGFIRPGYDLELDKLRELNKNGKSYIAALEESEKQATGISNLKVGFNSVFGYFIEVSKSNLAKVPAHYIRKQTTANAERYITAELKEHESQVLGAEEKATQLEIDLFQSIRARVAENSRALLQTAKALAELDVLSAFAEIAFARGYRKPTVNDSCHSAMKSARHPVVEQTNFTFVPNDLSIGDDLTVMILTGPNMAGKSTYLRQTALLTLMAQIGCFVPAEGCDVGIVDRIFARIGAKDELAMGQSTFMVEMMESANILNHATPKSLVILDEVGRGTSTFDGMAIAWAMIEYLAQLGCRTMFATHYHQLNALADQIPQVANFRVAVEEIGTDIVWTHRVLPGGTDQSYGIHVAKMAGIPRVVLDRARDILHDLEGNPQPVHAVSSQKLQLTLFEAQTPEFVEELSKLEVNSLTPVQALTLLDEWKRKWGE